MLSFRGGINLKEYSTPAVYGGDTVAPSVVLSTEAVSPVYGTFSVTATFSEDVSGFVVGDITVVGGSASNFQTVSPSVYTFDIATTGSLVTIQVPAACCTDAAGNDNTASNIISLESWAYLVSTFTQTISGINRFTNGNMETGIPPSNWTPFGATAGVSTERTGGAGVQSLSLTSTAVGVQYARQASVPNTGWMLLGGWIRKLTGSYAEIRGEAGTGSHPVPLGYYNLTTWGRCEGIFYNGGFNCELRINASAAGQEADFDDLYANTITPNAQQVLPSANAEIEVSLNLPVVTWAGQTLLIIYRVSVANQSWVAKLYRNPANTDWSFQLNSAVTAGQWIQRAQLLNIGTPEKLKVVCYGTQHQVSMYASGVWTPLHSVVTFSHNDAATGVNMVYSSGMEPVSYRVRVSSPFESGLVGTGLLLLDGDSKTDPTGSFGYWDFMLERLMEADGKNWSYYNIAEAGYSMNTAQSTLAARIAGLAASPQPDYALINFGANDVEGVLVEATWKNYMRSYINTMRGKWATIPMRFEIAWRQGYDANCNLLAQWMADVASEYSNVLVGPDERVWFKNNPSFWYGDIGVHYTGGGNRENAIQWWDYLT